MAAIYQADVWCDGCADSLKERIALDLWENRMVAITPDGVDVREFYEFSELDDYLRSMSERDYDSDSYPKGCDDDETSDSPQHCASHEDCVNPTTLYDGTKVGHFFGNGLTDEGEDYVKDTVREDIEAGRIDSVACLLWGSYYSWIEWDDIGTCTGCNNLAVGLDEDDYCPSCAECMASPE